MSSRIGEAPTFSGRTDPGSLDIQGFFRKLERWFLTNDTRNARWYGILDSVIDYPAKANYDAAIILGAAPGIVDAAVPPEAAPGADEAAQRAAHALRETAWRNKYINRKDWLIQTHHGPVEQDRIKTEIPTMKQGLNELPSHFYARVYRAVEDAGYLQATIETLARTVFETALHPEITYHLNMQPRLETVPMTHQADRIWRTLTGRQSMPKQYLEIEPHRKEIHPEPIRRETHNKQVQESNHVPVAQVKAPQEILKNKD